jgi:hypothetical protein
MIGPGDLLRSSPYVYAVPSCYSFIGGVVKKKKKQLNFDI